MPQAVTWADAVPGCVRWSTVIGLQLV